jgi:hypothetical protein
VTTPYRSAGYAQALRREIIHRNRLLVEGGERVAVSSYGRQEVVVYPADGSSHGNFFPESYSAILRAADWRRRLVKSHTGKRHLPKPENDKWRELDSCTSSDALLMNIFCHPETLESGRLHRLMSVDVDARPHFGVRVAAPLKSGHRDRTEVDMRFGDLLVEAKLTENDFQNCRPALVERYSDFEDVFDPERLPHAGENLAAYQLLRNVLAAHGSGARFCVIADARRPDLRETWFSVMQAVREHEMRLRCQLLTWQEIGSVVQEKLRLWLEGKYGIFVPGREPQLDASEWYW